MNGKIFEIGQAITPISDPNTWPLKEAPALPKFGGVYHVKSYNFQYGTWWIRLKEFRDMDNFDQEGFAPVVSDSVLSKELEEIFQEDLTQ